MLKRIRRAYPLKLELIPVLLLVGSAWVVLSQYSQLPQQIPIHFDGTGNPDRWGPKVILLLVLLVEGGLIYVPLTLFGLAFGLVGDSPLSLNLPGWGRRELASVQGEAIRIWVLRLLFVLKTLTIALLGFLLYNAIQVALERQGGLGWGLWVLVAALLAAPLIIGWKLLRIARPSIRSKEET